MFLSAKYPINSCVIKMSTHMLCVISQNAEISIIILHYSYLSLGVKSKSS